MPAFVKIRYEVILATENFRGKDHTGEASVAYKVSIPIKIFVGDDGRLSWAQLADRQGHRDWRFPDAGRCSASGDGLDLNWTGGLRAGRLDKFTLPYLRYDRGYATYQYMPKRPNQSASDSMIQWRGTGKWELLELDDDSISLERESTYLSTKWRFDTSNGAGGGVGIVAAGAGQIRLIDPLGKAWNFAYAGGGVGAGLKKMPKKSGSGSTQDTPSAGVIWKNPLVASGHELKSSDFEGQCAFADASVALGVGGGTTVFCVGMRGMLVPQPTAYIWCGGLFPGVTAGVGAYVGWLSSLGRER